MKDENKSKYQVDQEQVEEAVKEMHKITREMLDPPVRFEYDPSLSLGITIYEGMHYKYTLAILLPFVVISFGLFRRKFEDE